ncbi:DNA polymerase III subunit psi [Corallincola spongiicola]|uniref:DNA polymerase III subunit psi n=1 Tax=Corallincola spongiicola TaxID=2520508 RepID=A0ABY1WMN4_9GAMM|nr:DNA polymerase III subunit psi [Corallincola spongiicola]TAA43587.1 hypothetical protein EXY25_13600 [Corallincola spongiicola]
MSLSTLQQQVLAAMNVPTFEVDNVETLADDAALFVVYGESPEDAKNSLLTQRVLAILGIDNAEFHSLSSGSTVDPQNAPAVAIDGLTGWRMQGGDVTWRGTELITPPLLDLQQSAAAKRALWQCLMSRCDGFIHNNNHVEAG